MDLKLVYAKTPLGDVAVRQSTRVVQRTHRMVLVQVDGKLNVEELSAKIGNPRLVEKALHELEDGGFIAPTLEAMSIWEESKRQAENSAQVSALSQFSTFGPRSDLALNKDSIDSQASSFSSFDKPFRPVSTVSGQPPPSPVDITEPKPKSEKRPCLDAASRRLAWLSLLALPFLVVLAIIFYPYERHRDRIEQLTGNMLGSPVKISKVELSLWPRPALVLSNIRIEDSNNSMVKRMGIASPLSLLGSGVPKLVRVDISGASLTADQIVSLPMLQVPANQPGHVFSVGQIHFDDLSVGMSDVKIQELSGDIHFRPDGSVEKAWFENVDRSIRIDAQPTAKGIQLSVEAFSWKPFDGLLSFDAFQAKGLLQKGKLVIHDLDTTALGGVVKGSLLLDWSKGLAIAGDASLKGLDCRKLSAVFAPALKLEGSLAGALRLRAGAQGKDDLWANTEAQLDADITRGLFHGVDLGEAVRRAGGGTTRGGSTKFDRLQANLSINPRQVQGRNLQMDAGMMIATGQFLARRDQSLDANLTVVMQTSVSSVRAPVRLSGKLSEIVVNSRQ